MIVVNPSTRQFNIPGADLVFGVESDSGSEVKEFQCPRYVGNNLDLMGCFLRINYRNANGDVDSYLIEDATADSDNVTFSWVLSPKVTMYKGQVKFVLCATGPDTKLKWHTTLGTGQVYEGLEPDTDIIESETMDVVAQLIAMVEAQTEAVEDKGVEWVRNVQSEGTDQIIAIQTAASNAQRDAVAQIEAKGVNTLASIPEDYTAVQSAVRGAANAIRKKVSGEVIRVDDVSPMEHYPMVRVSNRNMCEITGEFVSTVGVGGYYTPKRLTYAAPYMENGKTYVFTAETDDELRDTVLSVVFYGLRASGATTLDSRSSPGVLRCVVTPSDFVRIDTVELRFNRIPSASATEERTITYRNVYFGLVEHEGKGYPYVDPTTVTIRRCGKNLLPKATAQGTGNGITFTVNDDGSVTVNGTATKNAAYNFTVDEVFPAGKYRLSGCPSGGGTDTYRLQANRLRDGVSTSGAIDIGTGATLTVEEGDLITTYLVVLNGQTVSNMQFYPMLRFYDADDGYEPGNVMTQIPTSDGTVSGLAALSPTMTLLTNAASVNIECEYSRDTNVVIAEILEKITALGG